LDQKKLLLNLALQSHHPDVVIVTINYLKNSLTSDAFDLILKNYPEAVNYYLKHLEESKPDRKEWERIILLTQRYEELGLYYYHNALKQPNLTIKHSKLEECVKFIKAHGCLAKYHEEIENLILNLSIQISL